MIFTVVAVLAVVALIVVLAGLIAWAFAPEPVKPVETVWTAENSVNRRGGRR